MIMKKILTYQEITEKGFEITSDANSYFSDEIDSILESGFDKNFPIVVSENGEILDGNHRYEAFEYHGRLDELFFAVCTWENFVKLPEGGARINDEDYQILLTLCEEF